MKTCGGIRSGLKQEVMMRILIVFALVLAAIGSVLPGHAMAAPICPTTSNTNSDCGIIVSLNADGTIAVNQVANAAPYDGNDDALVGVINNTGTVYTRSFVLSGSGNGGGIFGFDQDGICTYTQAAYCSSSNAATGYEGPLNTFTNISSGEITGTVDFSHGPGIPVGGTTFFSLEGSPGSINPVPAPEPMSVALLGMGLGSLLLMRRRRSN